MSYIKQLNLIRQEILTKLGKSRQKCQLCKIPYTDCGCSQFNMGIEKAQLVVNDYFLNLFKEKI